MITTAHHWLSCILCLLALQMRGQVPETALYVFQLTENQGTWHIHSPQFLSAWNPGGYTNQPEWVDAHTLLVSARLSESSQNDIYRLDLNLQKISKLTNTPESEYSPQLMHDGKSFSVVRQAGSDSIDQQVFAFPLDLSSAGTPVFPGVRDVGYYCWVGPAEAALYLVGEPPKLALMSSDQRTPRLFSSQIGRCLHLLGNGKLAYVHQYSDDFWYLKAMDLDTRRSEILVQTPVGREDFAVGPRGELFMGSGSTLYVLENTQVGMQWKAVFDLAIFGVGDITRLAINSDYRVAIVDRKS